MKLLHDLSGTIEEDGIIRDYPDSHHWVEDRKMMEEQHFNALYKGNYSEFDDDYPGRP